VVVEQLSGEPGADAVVAAAVFAFKGGDLERKP
jgi:hypothetical protein